ncbi:MAG: AsmA family protein [Geminicoccaceae bacterium]
MRLIAIIAIVCATLAGASLLFAPLVLDEDRAKASLETILSDLTGRNLVASGPAQLQLWPRPIATLVDVRIGEEREDWSAEVDRLDITIDPMALLIGRMRADSIEVVRPRVLLDDGRLGDWSDGLIALKEWAAEGPADALAVTIVDGLVATVTGGRPTAWQPVSGRVELDPSATSTVHLESERDAGSRVIADLTIEDLGGDRIAPSTLHLRMETEGTSHQLDLLGHADITPLAASFDGDLRFETNDGEAFRRLLDHHSAAGILSSLPLQNLPLNLEGRFRIEGAQVALENLRAGHGPLTISGSVLGRMASPIGIDAGLSFASDEPLPPLVDWLEAFETPPDASGFAGHVRLNANQLPVGTGAMERLSFSAKLAGDEGLEIETFEAILPGETTAAWAGTFSHAEGQTELVGQLEVAGSDLNRFLAWIRPDVAVGQSDEPQRFGASGELRANSEEIALRAARIRLDTSRLDGSVSLAAGVRPELAVRGSINRLNISPWMDTEQNLVDQLADLTRRTQAVDLDLDLDISRLIATDFTAGDLIIVV